MDKQILHRAYKLAYGKHTKDQYDMDKEILHRAYQLAYDKHTLAQYETAVRWFKLAMCRVTDKATEQELVRLTFVMFKQLECHNGTIS